MRNILALLLFILLGVQPAFANILPSMGVDAYNQAPKIRTYTATLFPTVAPYVLAQDICAIGGLSTKVVKVHHVRVYLTQTTAGVNGLFLVKRSSASVGAQKAISAVPHDSQTIAAGADVTNFTAAPSTTGTLVGIVRGADVFTPAPASTTTGGYFDFDFGPSTGTLPMILRANEFLALNFGGLTIPTGLVLSCEFNWTEE